MPYYLHGIYLTEADFDGGPVCQCRLMWTCFSFHSFFRYIFIRHSASKFIVFFYLGGNQGDIKYFLNDGYTGI